MSRTEAESVFGILTLDEIEHIKKLLIKAGAFSIKEYDSITPEYPYIQLKLKL